MGADQEVDDATTAAGAEERPAGARDDLRGGAARRPAEREDRGADGREGRVRPPAGRRRARHGRDDLVRPSALGAAARRRRGAARRCSATRASARAGRCWCPTRRAWTGRSALGVSAVAIFGSATETFARKNLNRSVEASVAMFAPVVERARAEGVWVRAYVSMCFGDPWEGDVPVGQVVDVAQRLMDLGCDQLSLGDTIGVGHHRPRAPAARRARRPGHRRGPDRRALPRHLRAGAGQHPGRARRRRHRRRRLHRWPGRVPLRPERHRQPGHRGPRLGAGRAGHRDRRRPRRAGRRRACGWPGSWGARRPRGSSRRWGVGRDRQPRTPPSRPGCPSARPAWTTSPPSSGC